MLQYKVKTWERTYYWANLTKDEESGTPDTWEGADPEELHYVWNVKVYREVWGTHPPDFLMSTTIQGQYDIPPDQREVAQAIIDYFSDLALSFAVWAKVEKDVAPDSLPREELERLEWVAKHPEEGVDNTEEG